MSAQSTMGNAAWPPVMCRSLPAWLNISSYGMKVAMLGMWAMAGTPIIDIPITPPTIHCSSIAQNRTRRRPNSPSRPPGLWYS